MGIDEICDMYGSILMKGFMPEVMIIGDARLLGDLPPGTYLFVKGQEPRKLGELEDFDRIWQDALLGHHYD